MTTLGRAPERSHRPRPGGRSRRIRSAVLAATLEILAESGFERMEVPQVARRAGVHPVSVYRRWGTKARLVGEALLEQAQVLSPTPDTGTVQTDLDALIAGGLALVDTPAVRGLFEVLLASSADAPTEVVEARDRFWAVHVDEARSIVDRAVARSELPVGTDPMVLVELLIGPVFLRSLLMGRPISPDDVAEVVTRALRAVGMTTADLVSDRGAATKSRGTISKEKPP